MLSSRDFVTIVEQKWKARDKMQIVIEISDKRYKEIVETDKPVIIYRSDVAKVLVNGTPLPKGHGDLIDRKELLKQPMDKANYPSNYVQIAPTIIKADEESEE